MPIRRECEGVPAGAAGEGSRLVREGSGRGGAAPRPSCQYVRCDGVLAAVCEWGWCVWLCVHSPTTAGGYVVLDVGAWVRGGDSAL